MYFIITVFKSELLVYGMIRLKKLEYCEIIYFLGAQFSWIHEIEYIRGDVISWTWVQLCWFKIWKKKISEARVNYNFKQFKGTI